MVPRLRAAVRPGTRPGEAETPCAGCATCQTPQKVQDPCPPCRLSCGYGRSRRRVPRSEGGAGRVADRPAVAGATEGGRNQSPRLPDTPNRSETESHVPHVVRYAAPPGFGVQYTFCLGSTSRVADHNAGRDAIGGPRNPLPHLPHTSSRSENPHVHVPMSFPVPPCPVSVTDVAPV